MRLLLVMSGLLGAVCAQQVPQSAQSHPIALEVVSRNPDSGATAKRSGVRGPIGTRGQSKDIIKIRISGPMPEGVELRTLYHWTRGGDVIVPLGEVSEPGAVDGKWAYLRGLQLALSGPRADDWILRYRAHVGFLGDVRWHYGNEFLGTRGRSRCNLQAIELSLQRRPPGPRSLQLVIPSVHTTERGNLFFVVYRDGTDAVQLHREPAADQRFGTADGGWVGAEGAPRPPLVLTRDALDRGATRAYHVFVFVQRAAAVEATPAAITGVLAALRRERAKDVGGAIGDLAGDRAELLGGFSVHLSLSKRGRLNVQYMPLPQAGTRVLPNPRADAFGEMRFGQFALGASGGVRLRAVVTDAL